MVKLKPLLDACECPSAILLVNFITNWGPSAIFYAKVIFFATDIRNSDKRNKCQRITSDHNENMCTYVYIGLNEF